MTSCGLKKKNPSPKPPLSSHATKEANHEDSNEDDEVPADSQSALDNALRWYSEEDVGHVSSQCPVPRSSSQQLHTSQSQSVEPRWRSKCPVDDSHPSHTSQSVRGVSEDQRRPSVSSHSHTSSQVIFRCNESNPLKFVGRAEQLCQGETHGGSQAEGCLVSLAHRGEGGVTPAHTPSHVVRAKLCRQDDVEDQHHPQEHLHGTEEEPRWLDQIIYLPR